MVAPGLFERRVIAMKPKKISTPAKVEFISAEELLREKGITREEWNDRIAEMVKAVEADGTLSDEEKGQRIASLLLQTITVNNRFLFEELFEGEGLWGD